MAGAKGGRGGQGAARNRTGGGPTPTVQTDDQIIASALGTQGSPKTISDATHGANPNYTAGVRNEWSTNCQRCVWATEMRRRGYDVEALPRTSDDDYATASTSVAKSFLNVAEGGLKLDGVQGYWKKTATDFKAHFTDKYDVGARGMIVASTPGRSGHVFNWEVVQGKSGKQIRFYDGQPGNDNVSVTTMQRKWAFFSEARMDNAKVTKLIKDFVKPR